MARPLRIELGLHHVVSHGNGRLWLFRNDEQRRYFLNLLGASALKYSTNIHTFVLMTNHIHLLVETLLPNLNQFMRKLLGDYALYYNKWYRRRGSVFKSRYGSFLIEKDNYYHMVVQYICNNPVRAGIVERPAKYRWGSLYYLLHKRLMKRELSWYRAADMLALVGGRCGLGELLRGEDPVLPVVYGKFIGDKEWADRIVNENYDRLTDEISHGKEMRVGVTNPMIVIKTVAKAFGARIEELLKGRNREARMWCLYILHRETPLDARRLGILFGLSKWAVLKTVQRLEHKKKTKRELKVLNEIKMKMSNVQT